MLTERETKLLSLLEKETPCTVKEAAEALHVTTRTIRNDIPALNRELANSASISIDPKKGILLIVEDKEAYQNIKNKNMDLPQYPEQRARRLACMLLRQKGYVKTENLADALFVSESTVTRDLKLVKKMLAEFDLKLVGRPRYGLKIQGQELQKRLCYAWLSHSKLSKWHANRTMSEIEKIVLEAFAKAGFVTTEFALQNLLIHLGIALERMTGKQYMLLPDEIFQELKDKEEFTLAAQITKEMESAFHVSFPEEETAYVCMHLLGKQMQHAGKDSSSLVIQEYQHAIVEKSLKRLDEEFCLNLSNDFDLQLALTLHMVPLTYRMKYGLALRNPILQEIKDTYPFAWLLALTLSAWLKEELQKEITQDETGYLALHLQLSLEKGGREIQKKNIVLVCSTGQGTARLLEHKYRTKFGPYIGNLVLADSYQAASMDYSNIDFVFSTVPLTCPLPVPVIYTTPLLSGEDESLVIRHLDDERKRLLKYVPSSLFFHETTFENPDAYFQWILSKLKEHYELPESFLEQLEKRESLHPTSFANGVATPHPAVLCTQDTFVSITVLDKPVQWNGFKVSVIVLVSLEKGNNPDCVTLFQSIAETLAPDKNLEKLRQTPSYEMFQSLFVESESS